MTSFKNTYDFYLAVAETQDEYAREFLNAWPVEQGEGFLEDEPDDVIFIDSEDYETS